MPRPRKYQEGSTVRVCINLPRTLHEAVKARTSNVSAYFVELAELDTGLNVEEILNHQIAIKSNRLLTVKEQELELERDKAALEQRRAALQARRSRWTEDRLALMEKVGKAHEELLRRGYEEVEALTFLRHRLEGWTEELLSANYHSVDEVMSDYLTAHRRTDATKV